jgi:hypothetical protein
MHSYFKTSPFSFVPNCLKRYVNPAAGEVPPIKSNCGLIGLVTVEDNGIGREASQKLQPSGKVHYGLDVTRKRLDLLNELEKTDINSIRIFDLHDGNVPAGTQVTVQLGIKKS